MSEDRVRAKRRIPMPETCWSCQSCNNCETCITCQVDVDNVDPPSMDEYQRFAEVLGLSHIPNEASLHDAIRRKRKRGILIALWYWWCWFKHIATFKWLKFTVRTKQKAESGKEEVKNEHESGT